MVYKKWPALILFAVSFIILSISGYQCAGPPDSSPKSDLDNFNLDNFMGNSDGNSTSLRRIGDSTNSETDFNQRAGNAANSTQSFNSEGQGDREEKCPRTVLREDLQRSEGEMAVFLFNSSALKEFRLGQSPNYDSACSRLYLNMNETSKGSNIYTGTMTLVYVGVCANGEYGICQTRMSTGYNAEDARYNRWSTGDWKVVVDSRGRRVVLNKEFNAIFEDDGYGAYILKLKGFVERNIEDGRVFYEGFGNLYFKMFRTATKDDVHVSDQAGDCYNTGTYISLAREVPSNRPSIRCWFVNTGPFHCRPQGDLLINSPFKAINLFRNDYKCYRLLGKTRDDGINIGRAFNVSDPTKL